MASVKQGLDHCCMLVKSISSRSRTDMLALEGFTLIAQPYVL